VKQEQKQSQLMSRLGHEFKNPDLLSEALTHSSLSSVTRRDNQRLEFLGDRVLGLVISEALLELDQDASEGDLAPRFNTMVRKETCADIATEIKLGDALLSRASEAARDGKTMLQEWAQARGMAPPDYTEIGRSGPDHAPIFTIKVTLETGQSAEAQANSKRAGQQAAATALLESIEHD